MGSRQNENNVRDGKRQLTTNGTVRRKHCKANKKRVVPRAQLSSISTQRDKKEKKQLTRPRALSYPKENQKASQTPKKQTEVQLLA